MILRAAAVIARSRPPRKDASLSSSVLNHARSRFAGSLRYPLTRPCLVRASSSSSTTVLQSSLFPDQETIGHDRSDNHSTIGEVARLPNPILASKPWLDELAPLHVRVKSLLAAPMPLHPADAHSDQVFHLIKQCCKQQQQQSSSGPPLRPLQTLTWAQDILERLVLEKKQRFHQLQQQSSGSVTASLMDLSVNIKLWNLLIFGWARQLSLSDKPQAVATQSIAPMRLQQIVERAIEEAIWDEEHLMTPDVRTDSSIGATECESGVHGNMRRTSSLPTVDIFNTYLHGLVQSASTSRNAHLQAQSTLQQMDEYYTLRGWHCRPNTKSYSLALAACASVARAHPYHKEIKAKMPAYMAFDLLRKMQAAHVVEKSAYQEQFQVAYNTHRPDQNRRRVVTADSVAYTTTMQAMVNTISYASVNQPRRNIFQRQQQQLANKVLELLQEMMDCRDGTIAADSAAFVVALQAFSKLAASSQQSLSFRNKAARNCELILQMRTEYVERVKKNDNEHHDGMRLRLLSDLTEPRSIRLAFNICLDAWSKSGAHGAVEECERIFQIMLSPDSPVLPSTSSMHACLRAWSLSSSPDAADRAYELLKLQHDLVASGLLPADARPDFQSYSLLILAVANSGAYAGLDRGQKARALLDEMIQGTKQGIVLPLRNPAAPFSAVLTAAAVSMAELSSSNAAATDTDDNEGVDAQGWGEETDDDASREAIYSIALKTYQDAKQDTFCLGFKPDHHLYAAMLRVVTAAFPVDMGADVGRSEAKKGSATTERASMAEAIMADAQESGQVSRLVVHAWAGALSLDPTDALSSLLRDNHQRQLPKLWTRHVPPEFRFRAFFKGKQSSDRRPL